MLFQGGVELARLFCFVFVIFFILPYPSHFYNHIVLCRTNFYCLVKDFIILATISPHFVFPPSWGLQNWSSYFTSKWVQGKEHILYCKNYYTKPLAFFACILTALHLTIYLNWWWLFFSVLYSNMKILSKYIISKIGIELCLVKSSSPL